jgi:antitoxin ParD1/3/4
MISIPDELAQFVDREIASGKFRSQHEVVAAGLRLLQSRERRLDALRADLQFGIDQLDGGQGIVIPDDAAHQSLFDDLRSGT